MKLSSIFSLVALSMQVFASPTADTAIARESSHIETRSTLSTILTDIENIATCAGCNVRGFSMLIGNVAKIF